MIVISVTYQVNDNSNKKNNKDKMSLSRSPTEITTCRYLGEWPRRRWKQM